MVSRVALQGNEGQKLLHLMLRSPEDRIGRASPTYLVSYTAQTISFFNGMCLCISQFKANIVFICLFADVLRNHEAKVLPISCILGSTLTSFNILVSVNKQMKTPFKLSDATTHPVKRKEIVCTVY